MPFFAAIDPHARRVLVYDTDMKLLAETEFSSNWAKAIGYEYVYLGDRPLAQVEVSGCLSSTYWLGTDHLGTPLLRTTATRAIDWRAEAEPYGRIWTLRGTTAKHMPLRFPGQEAEQLTTETNGVSGESLNSAVRAILCLCLRTIAKDLTSNRHDYIFKSS